MGSLQEFAPAITHWCFGITILIGLVSSKFSGLESVFAILIASCTSTLSAVCSCTTQTNEVDQFKRRRLTNLLTFLIIWLDILCNLVAAATCARLASATVDYISNGHFREFLFGLEQHSLGEPWPDVLGVTIILVVTVLFMMGLEKSSTISVLLFLALLCHFAFFTIIGSFHTVNNFQKWMKSFRMIHSPRTVLKAAASCSFAFVHKMPMTSKNHCLKIATIFFMPLLFYTVLAIIFSLMTNYRDLISTAIPLIQVFENRDVDWARPVIAVLTICVVCLLLTEVLPCVYFSFVQLASKEWRVFVSSIQYQSSVTGAPVLAIFAAGSLAAILAFACPLSHLIKLLNVSCLVKNVLNSCHLVYSRYKPEVLYNDLPEEQECLLFGDKSLNVDIPDDSNSENEENEMEIMPCGDGEDSDSSTDIDVIVEEYREGLRVSTVGKFNERKPCTKTTSIIVIMCLFLIILASISIALYIFRIIKFYWPDIFAIFGGALIITGLPENASEKSKPCLLPPLLFPLFHSVSITMNIIMAAMIISTVWQGVVFWTISGLLLYWRCDCCQCEILEPLVAKTTSAADAQHIIYEYKENLPEHIIIAR